MRALQETTKHTDGTPNHTYLVDETFLHAYIKAGTNEIVRYSPPLKNFDRRHRTFKEVNDKVFK